MVDLSEVIEILTLVFVAASIALLILDRFSHPALPAYILAGLVIGPFIPTENIIILSEIGIAFLVFIFGVKLDPSRLRSVAKESQFTTTVEIGVVGLLAFITGNLVGLTTLESLYFSIFAALSSSLVGLQLIENEIQIDLIHGRIAESIQLIQDIVAIVALIGLTAAPGGQENVLRSLTSGTLLMLTAFGVRVYFFDFIASLMDGSRELLMITSIAFLSGFIGMAEYLGLSIVVGSFAAGLAVAKFPHNIEILDTTGSLKDFFSAVFFISLGALATFPDPRTLLIAGLLVIFTTLIKPAVTVLSLLMQGFDDRTAHLTGFSLDQISEFSLILGISGYLSGTLPLYLFNGLILAATFTMISSAYTSRHEEFLYQKIRSLSFIPSRRRIEDSEDLETLEDHVILVGYDTQGKEIAEALKSENAEFVIIENDPEKVEDIREKEEKYVYGDVMDDKPWETARADSASMIMSTVPVQKVSERILKVETDADILLRASEVAEASELLENGATYVNVPEIVSSEMLVDHIEGVLQNTNYREELRRRNLLEIKRFIQDQEG